MSPPNFWEIFIFKIEISKWFLHILFAFDIMQGSWNALALIICQKFNQVWLSYNSFYLAPHSASMLVLITLDFKDEWPTSVLGKYYGMYNLEPGPIKLPILVIVVRLFYWTDCSYFQLLDVLANDLWSKLACQDVVSTWLISACHYSTTLLVCGRLETWFVVRSDPIVIPTAPQLIHGGCDWSWR